MRVVLDINILVSAAITSTTGQQGRAIIDQAGEQYTLILSGFMLWKLQSVLHYDHIQSKYPHLTENAIQAFLSKLIKISEAAVERTVITDVDGGSQDPEDNHILAAAVDGKADYVVTRDTAHFPSSFRGITRITPADFLQLLHDTDAQESGESEQTDAS